MSKGFDSSKRGTHQAIAQQQGKSKAVNASAPAKNAATVDDIRKWDDVSDADLRGALAGVKYGYDPTAARNLIEYFHERMRDHRPLNERILREYIEYAFARIVRDGKSTDVAFGLKLVRGKYRRKDTTERDVRAASYITLAMRKNVKWQVAVGDAANLLFPDGKGGKAVEKAYESYRDIFRNLPDKYLKAMLPEDTPVIKPFMAG